MADHRLQIVLAAKDVTGKAFTRLQGRITSLTKSVFSLKGGLVAMAGAYGLKMAAGAALDVAASFEQMEVKLDALTKGQGKKTLDEINAWALEMPVNTRKAVDTFAMMQAMGLDPTIEKMQTLVDTSSIFGEQSMPRVARALGQMATLGKLSAEELNQMSEAGINARKYLTEAFGMTVQELQKSQVSIEQIIDAIWQGLDADFGGAAKKAQDSWRGMTLTFKSYMDEILKLVMDAGVFKVIKDQLKDINSGLKTWIENNAELIKQKVPIYLDQIAIAVTAIGKAAKIALKAWMLLLDTTGIGKLIDAYQQYIDLTHQAETAGQGVTGFNMETSDPADFGVNTPAIIEQKDAIFKTTRAVDELDYAIADLTDALSESTLPATQYAATAVDELDYAIADLTDALSESTLAATDYADEIERNVKKAAEASAEAAKRAAEETKRAFDQVANRLSGDMANAFTDIITGAKNAKEAFRDFAQSTIRWIMQMIIKQLIFNSISSAFGYSGGATANAHGNVYDQSGLVPFARGGVVNRPTIFPFASGVGLMAEKGPEAILPLTRTTGGDLGVKAEGGAGGGNNINIMAVDSKSFEDMVRRNPAGIIKVVNDAMTGNAALRSTMRSTI